MDPFDRLAFPLGVVAHDAGAANHIIAWLKGRNTGVLHPCMKGPAERLWAESFGAGPNAQLTLPQIVGHSRMLLTGTGWASTLEHDARKLSRSARLRSVAVLDHWTNYRERFVRAGEEALPDEIWVSDEYAKSMAEREFPGLEVIQLPNVYVDGLVREIQREEHPGAERGRSVLYVLEPIREPWGDDSAPGEFQALDFFMQTLDRLGAHGELSIRLRPHPSEPAGKYRAWVREQNGVRISLEESASLAQCIAWADIVVGCHTYALVVALAAGRRVVSSIPPWAPPCVLPHAGIQKLAELARR